MIEIYDCIISKEKIVSFGINDNLLYIHSFSTVFEINPSHNCKSTKILNNIDAKYSFFKENQNYFITYDKNLLEIYDIYIKKKINTIKIELLFCDFSNCGRYLFSVSKQNRVYIYKTDNPISLGRLISAKKHDIIKSIYHYQNLLAVGTFEGYLYILDIYTKEIVYKKNNFLSIYNVKIFDDVCILGHIDGSISLVDYKIDTKKNITTPFLKKIVSIQRYYDYIFVSSEDNFLIIIDIKLKKIINQNYVKISTPIKDFKIFNKNLLVCLLESDKIVFVDLKLTQTKQTNKQNKINKKYIESFKAFYREKNYPQAFITAQKEPFIKSLPEYKKIENIFYQTLKLCIKYIKQNKSYKAKEILGVYARVDEKKEIVSYLLNYKDEFLEFLISLKQNDHKKIFKLIQKNPKFENFTPYKNYKEKFYNHLKELKKHINDIELNVDFDYLYMYKNFDNKTNEIYQLLVKTKELKKLFDKGDFYNCYIYIENNEELKSNIIYKILQKHYKETIIKCEDLALKSDIKKLIKKLDFYIKIPSKQKKIGDILRVASLVKIKNTLDTKNYKICEKLFYEYLDLFGKDKEFIDFQKIFEQSSGIKLAIDLTNTKREDKWIKRLF